jgi:hypothetical protein
LARALARREKVEMELNIRHHAERIAREFGLDADALIAEAEAVVRGS